MIVVKLMGGLGNQMFQYAAGRRLSLAHDTPLYLDVERLKLRVAGETKREFALGPLSIVGNKYDAQDRLVMPSSQRWYGKLKTRLSRKDYIRIYGQHDQMFDPRSLTLPDNTYLEGEFQSEKYFEDYSNAIKKDFLFKIPPTGKNQSIIADMRCRSSVSVHVRRGDYVTNPSAKATLGSLPNKYYHDSIAHIQRKVESPMFYVFSDEIEWCKKNLKMPVNTHFIDHNKSAAEDLRLMIACRHHIIANSSLSWWGAWLGESNGTNTVAPKNWFANQTLNSEDLVPERWTRL